MSGTAANEERLRRLLGGSRFATVTWVEETGSTNADLVRLGANPATPEQVMLTEFQSAGRGRRNRQWDSSPHSALMMSILIRPAVPLAAAHRYTTAVGLAARDACEHVADVRPRLKWPNDLVFGNRKLAGILAESVMDGDRFVGLVVGIGLNVLTDGDLPAEVRQRATSLAAEAVDTPEIDRVQLAARLISRFEWWCGADPEELRTEHLAHSSTCGSQVRVDQQGTSLFGMAQDIDRDGRLIVEDESGVRHTLSVGDVTHLRRV